MLLSHTPESPALLIHDADGTDPQGNKLSITIRIAPNGSLYFQDITAALAPVVAAMNPSDPVALKRATLAREFVSQQPLP
jgi:hypothetical protein